jgi:hypothetical protein
LEFRLENKTKQNKQTNKQTNKTKQKTRGCGCPPDRVHALVLQPHPEQNRLLVGGQPGVRQGQPAEEV